VSKFFASSFQVREARPHHIFDRICLFDESMMIERSVCEFNWLKLHIGLCGCVWVAVTQKNSGGH